MGRSASGLGWLLILGSVVVSGCAGAEPSRQTAGPDAQRTPARTKTLNIGVAGGVQTFSVVAPGTPTGGWRPLTDIHTEGLVTSDVNSRRKVGRLAENVPTLEDGGISLLADGRMRVVWNLRKGVTWHDGTPFTAHDLVFTYQFIGPGGMPAASGNDAAERMDSVEAPDESTFIIYYKQPYNLGTSLGPSMFWPLPRHILSEPFQEFQSTGNVDKLLQHPYWTSEYIHTGAFRVTRFDPGEGVSFQAYDRYFLGRPKIDVIHVKFFGDENTLLASLLAGATDLMPELAVRASGGEALRDAWKNGDGVVYVQAGPLRRLNPQFRPQLQMEPTVLDPRVRTALFQALDREELAETVGGGNRHLTAWAIVPPGDDHYEAVKDGLRPFPYSPDRAKAILSEVGWTQGPGGSLRHSSDGRPFRTSIWGNPDAGQELAAYASYWRAIGLEVEEFTIGGALRTDSEARAQFPGWESTAGDIIDQMEATAATAQTRWRGNRNGYEDPRAQALVANFRRAIAESDQARAIRAISDFIISEMLTIFTFANPTYLAARKNVKAYTDLAGGKNWEFFGSYYRNAYLWDIE